MDQRNYIVAKILLFDGVLLIVLAFVYLLTTPLINQWLSRELNAETLRHVSPAFLLNHIVVGILLIPFGVNTLYCAAGVRAGQRWARGIAITNALSIILLPLIIIAFIGPHSFNTLPFLIAGIAITVIGLTMFIPLVWLRGRSTDRASS